MSDTINLQCRAGSTVHRALVLAACDAAALIAHHIYDPDDERDPGSVRARKAAAVALATARAWAAGRLSADDTDAAEEAVHKAWTRAPGGGDDTSALCAAYLAIRSIHTPASAVAAIERAEALARRDGTDGLIRHLRVEIT